MTQIQPIAARVPYMVGIGNHEYDHLRATGEKDTSGALGPGGFRPICSGVSRGGQLGNCPLFQNLLPTNFFEMMAITQYQKILLPMHVRRLKLYDFNVLSLDEI